MSDPLREIDEEIRNERYLELWKRYGPWAIAAAVLLVVIVAGYQGWKGYQHDQAVASARTYAQAVAALNDDNPGAARETLSGMADPAAGGYKLLAAFRLAETQAAMDEPGRAVETWTGIADADVPPAYAHLATIQATMHALDAPDVAVPKARLRTLASGAGALRGTGRELEALLAMTEGETDKAQDLYTSLAEAEATPAAQRQRARRMLTLLDSA